MNPNCGKCGKELNEDNFGGAGKTPDDPCYCNKRIDSMFKCDDCQKEITGETYQDKTGNIFVCGDCFEKSNDGAYYITVEERRKVADSGVCVTDEELQEEIRLSGRLDAVETLRGIYQDLQNENEERGSS